MESAIGSSIGVVAYLALFGSIGVLFVFVNLLVGRFVRPNNPHAEKQEIYECGEPAIGSSFVQFDLRFYVVALVFIIFDVEVAFLFPWATVFGKATNLVNDRTAIVAVEDGNLTLSPTAAAAMYEMGIRQVDLPQNERASVVEANVRQDMRQLAWAATLAVSFFFVVLLIGFAYEWRTGALDWVRAVTKEQPRAVEMREIEPPVRQESVLSA